MSASHTINILEDDDNGLLVRSENELSISPNESMQPLDITSRNDHSRTQNKSLSPVGALRRRTFQTAFETDDEDDESEEEDDIVITNRTLRSNNFTITASRSNIVLSSDDEDKLVDLVDDDKGSDIHEELYEEIESDEDIQSIRKTLENPPPETKNGFKSYECPICFDHPNVISVIPCGHMYCSDCVFKAIAVKGNCSICRKNVTYKQVKFLEVRIKTQDDNSE